LCSCLSTLASGFVASGTLNLRDNPAALASSVGPALDLQVRAIRQQRRQSRESFPATWLRHAAYFGLVVAAIIEASKA
jgi:hypothetical protein